MYPQRALGNSSQYYRHDELSGIGDWFKKIGGAVKRIGGAVVGATKEPAREAATQAVVRELRQVPGYGVVREEVARQEARSAIEQYGPYVAIGAVALLLLSGRKR